MHFSIKISEKSMPIATHAGVLSVTSCGDPNYLKNRDEFLASHPQFGFRYQPIVQDYYMQLSGEAAIDASFLIVNDKIPLVFAPFVLEKIDGVYQGSYSGGVGIPTPLFHAMLSENQRRSLEKMTFDSCVKILHQYSVNRWFIYSDSVSDDHERLEDLMPARFGAFDISTQCHVMDLTLPTEDLWAEIRHSAKSTINQGLKTYQFKMYDRNTYTPEIGDHHRLLHHKCSGRVTRPIETFNQMYSWIKSGAGLMFEQSYQGRVIQMIMVALGKKTACGASAADDPDFDWKVPMTHSMNFFIYQELKRLGFSYYEVGETAYRESIFQSLSSKERSICDFKRGFGRRSFPLKRWAWFASKDEEIKFISERLENYKKISSEGE